MKRVNSQKGQALVLIALAIVGLIGFTALTVDGGRVLSDRRHAQNAADASALAAALAKIQDTSGVPTTANAAAENKALERADSNGYHNDGVGSDVIVNIPPVGGTYDGNPEYIQVIIHSYVSTTFARVLGRTMVENTVEAITRVQGSTSTTNPWGNAGMVAVRHTNERCFTINGSANLHIHGSGISVNCTAPDTLFVNGNTNVTLDDDINIAGCYTDQHNQVVFNNPGDAFQCDISMPVLSASDFSGIQRTLPAPDCSSLPLKTSSDTYEEAGYKVFPPGRYTASQTANSDAKLKEGLYCFLGGLNLNANASLVGTGTIQIVLQNGDLNLANNSNNVFNDLEIYSVDGDLSSKGSIYADSIRFFATGTGSFDLNNGDLTSGDAYFYTYGGNFVINSSSVLNLTAPDEGPFAGLLFYKPWGNNIAFDLNGGTNSYIKGTILMPTTEVTLNGGSGMEVHGQVVAATFIIDGGNEADIYYDPTDDTALPQNPTIEITK